MRLALFLLSIRFCRVIFLVYRMVSSVLLISVPAYNVAAEAAGPRSQSKPIGIYARQRFPFLFSSNPYVLCSVAPLELLLMGSSGLDAGHCMIDVRTDRYS